MDHELVQYLEERFDRQEQGFNARFEEVHARLDERTEEVKRHTGVLTEGLRCEVQLVAESLAMHIQVQHVQEREYFDRKFGHTDALIRSSYDHLQQQQDQIRRRVERLERNSPSSQTSD